MKRFDCEHVCPYLCVFVGTFNYPLCGRAYVWSQWHTSPIWRHITLQMTLLDADGPFNYSTLIQSPVNTYISPSWRGGSCLSFWSFFFLATTLFFSLSHAALIWLVWYIIVVSFVFFFYLLFAFPPHHYLHLKVLCIDTPQPLSYSLIFSFQLNCLLPTFTNNPTH